MKKAAHITVGPDPLCSWTSTQAGIEKRQKAEAANPGVTCTCGHESVGEAEAAARALRPYFRRGAVRVVTGECPIMAGLK